MAHTASLSQLQSPKWALVNGELTPYEDVRIHISAEALTRGLSVFEGLKGYWDSTGHVFSLRSPRRHHDRLRRSAAVFQIPVEFSYDEMLAGFARLAGELLVPDRDLWFRATLYVTGGHWGEGTSADLVVTAFTQRKDNPEPMRLGVSTWRRASDDVLPTRVKSGANYVIARLARIEARRLGYDDAILLNAAGRVAEATGACVVLARDGRVVTPPPSEGSLDSITVDVVREVCADLDIPFERRPVERTELLVADECGLAGTISELTLVDEVDGHRFAQDGVLSRVRQRYLQVMRAECALPSVELVALVDDKAAVRSR